VFSNSDIQCEIKKLLKTEKITFSIKKQKVKDILKTRPNFRNEICLKQMVFCMDKNLYREIPYFLITKLSEIIKKIGLI